MSGAFVTNSCTLYTALTYRIILFTNIIDYKIIFIIIIVCKCVCAYVIV